MPQAPVLRNTCHGPRTSIPQRVGCLPPHTERVQQDIHPPDTPALSAQKRGNTTKGVMSQPTANEDDPRTQHAAVGAWDNYVDPHPDGDKPRPRDPHATACPAATPSPPRSVATTRRKTTRSAPERSTPPPACRDITSTRIPTTTSHGRGTPTPTPAPPPPHPRSRPRTDHDELRGKPDFLSEANGPSAVALQQGCHRASAPARRPSRPPMPRPRPQRPPRPSESRISSPLRNRILQILQIFVCLQIVF